jgi:hypothetical protein
VSRSRRPRWMCSRRGSAGCSRSDRHRDCNLSQSSLVKLAGLARRFLAFQHTRPRWSYCAQYFPWCMVLVARCYFDPHKYQLLT